MTKSLLRSICN